MKKFIIILVSIFLLSSSFALGFFVKKHIDDKKIDSLNLAKLKLKNKNEKFAEKIISLGKPVKYNNKEIIYGYKKDKIAPIDYYLYDSDPDRFDKININKNGDVEYKGKVIFKDNGEPLNDDTAYTTLEMKIMVAAKHIEPREGCDPSDFEQNGTFGCYVDIPDDN